MLSREGELTQPKRRHLIRSKMDGSRSSSHCTISFKLYYYQLLLQLCKFQVKAHVGELGTMYEYVTNMYVNSLV